MPFPLPAPLCPELTTFHDRITEGTLESDTVALAPGIALRADPRLGLRGRYSSPAGRFLELEAAPDTGPGDWVGLHVALPLCDLSQIRYVGFVCRHAASEQWMLRSCLRSGLDGGDGFVDCFFDKHILTGTHPRTHTDVMFTDAVPDLPIRAPWRELVLFLPTVSFDLHLHHVFPFAL